MKSAWNGLSVLARAAGGANASRLTVASRSASDARCRRLEDLKYVSIFHLDFLFLFWVSMTSRHEKSLTMFSIAFMVVVFVPGDPGDADRFPFLPETLSPHCKESLDPMLRIAPSGRYVFGLVSRERISRTNDTVLGSFPATRRRLPNREVADLSFVVTHRTCTTPGAMRRPSSGQLLIVGHSEVRQRVVGMLGRAAAAEFDVPRERRGSRIRIERRRR